MPSSGCHLPVRVGVFRVFLGAHSQFAPPNAVLVRRKGQRLKLQLVSKRRSGGWSFTHRARSAPGRRGVKAGLKAEADPQIGKTNWLRKENRIYVWAGTSTSRRATV